MDTPKSGQSPYNGQTVCLLLIHCLYISTSEEGTTSEQRTKRLSPMCPLFGGSTVVYRNVENRRFLYKPSGTLACLVIKGARAYMVDAVHMCY